jgi:TonB family protein
MPPPRTRGWAWWVPVPAVVVAIAFVAMMVHRKANPPGESDIAAPVIAVAPVADALASAPTLAFEGPVRTAPETVAVTMPIPVFEIGHMAEPEQQAVSGHRPSAAKALARAEVRTESTAPAAIPAAAPVPADVREQVEDQLGETFEDEESTESAPAPTQIEKNIDQLLDDGAGDLKMKKVENAAPTRKAIERDEVKKAIATVRRRILNCATRAQVHGVAKLKFTVAPSGRLTSAAIKGSHAGTEFATCAEAAARKMRFKAYDGAPSTFTIPVPLNL